MKNIAYLVLAINLLASDVLSQATPTTAVENNKLVQDYRATIDDISGTWNPASLGYGYTALANLAHSTDDTQSISFTFFPMEYCQAIRICVPPNQEFSASNPFHMKESYCTSSITYSPASGEITITSKPDAEIKGYVDFLTFTPNPGHGHLIDVSKTPFYRTETYKTTVKVEKTKALTNKLLIVLSNSRQCQVNINIDGSLSYSDLLIPARTKPSTELPKLFHYAGSVDALQTFYTETSTNKKRTQDFLKYIKLYTTAKDSLKNIKYKCNVAAGSKTSRSTVRKHSIVHASKIVTPGQLSADTPRISRITVDTEQCHWIRLWFTTTGTTWDKYASKIDSEIHQTIDLFFDEGFALLPDRENAIRLPGGAKEIKSVAIFHHGNGLGEISFGYIENDRINSINFQMDFLKSDTFEVFLIRSPFCDANLGSEGVSTGTFGSGSSAKIVNTAALSSCKVYSIQK